MCHKSPALLQPKAEAPWQEAHLKTKKWQTWAVECTCLRQLTLPDWEPSWRPEDARPPGGVPSTVRHLPYPPPCLSWGLQDRRGPLGPPLLSVPTDLRLPPALGHIPPTCRRWDARLRCLRAPLSPRADAFVTGTGLS